MTTPDQAPATTTTVAAHEKALRGALHALHGRPLAGRRPACVANDRGMYLSGHPYLWTSFGERAYCFAEDDARALLRREVDNPLLRGARVVVRERAW